MSFEIVLKAVLMVFLLGFSYQDIKEREISIVGIFVFYFVIATMYIYAVISGIEIDLKAKLLGAVLGVILIIFSRFGFIGIGDALVFIGSGMILGWIENLLLFFVTVLLISLYSLFLSFVYFSRGRTIRGESVAMLPFVSIAGTIMVLLCV